MRWKKWAPLLWLALLGLIGWALSDRLRAIRFEDIVGQLRALPAHILMMGVLCSAAIYCSVGLYEGLAVRMATGRRTVFQPLYTALIANPIGRAVGAAVLSGGALRYRLYSAVGIAPRQVTAIVLLALMPYLLAVGWLVDLSLLLNAKLASRTLHAPELLLIALGALGLLKDIGWLVFVATRTGPVQIRGRKVVLPSLRHCLVQTAFGLSQICLMSAILYLFMPAELGMSWPAFIGLYCIAFIAGQLSNVPAGLGVLEAALLLMLPQVPPAELLGAVLAYRAVYEVLPLLVAAALLLVYETTHPAGLVRRGR